MTSNRILRKIKYLDNFDGTETEKIEFIEKLYKLANISFSEHTKNGQTNQNK